MSEDIESHILQKYEIIQKIGKGAYGVVWKAIDISQKKLIALKKIFDAFQTDTDSQRTYREVAFLREFGSHPNIIKLQKIIKSNNDKDLYLVFDFMETDLHSVIRANILEEVHKKYIIYQLMKALKYVHSGEVIHRDLKPSNILMNSSSLVRLADFGLARTLENNEDLDGGDSEIIMSDYVATRWYRAPEILFGSQLYTKAVDIWSLGCIIAEMISGKVLFPGTSSLNQIERILEFTGKPKIEDIVAIDSEMAENLINGINLSKKKNLNFFFPLANEDALELVQKMLVFNPNLRITLSEALKHKYFQEFRNIDDESTLDYPIKLKLPDGKKLKSLKYKEAIYEMISSKFKKKEKLVSPKSKLQNYDSNEFDLLPESEEKFKNNNNEKNSFKKIHFSPLEKEQFNSKNNSNPTSALLKEQNNIKINLNNCSFATSQNAINNQETKEVIVNQKKSSTITKKF